MSGPYRDSGTRDSAEGARDQGIVGDVIAQFADEKAFYRELVQNAIDAGTPSVDIEITYDDSAQRVKASVKDRGDGMTREIVENQLLVLFRSTKEKEKGKIGKFGIGFTSVLSPNPEVVVVHTSRDKRRLTLHLYRDLSYELFDAGPATQNGTTVELEIAMNRDDVANFVSQSEASLVRWCRHASVPIDFTDKTSGQEVSRRIDRPLDLQGALVEVRGTTDNGQLTAVVGLAKESDRNLHPYVGFFNHGLMLYETNDPLMGKLAVKIQDSRLGHTISRDDVRRDEHFHRSLEYAREVAKEQLPRAATEKLRQLAEQAATGKGSARAEHATLITAIRQTGIVLDVVPYPLVEPLGEQRTVDVKTLGRRGWAAEKKTSLTAQLAKRGTPVVDLMDVASFRDDVTVMTGCLVRDVAAELTSVTPVEHTDADEALLALLEELFDKAHRKPKGIMIAALEGVRADLLAIACSDEDAADHFVDRDEASRDPFALLSRRKVVLSANHRLVKKAREAEDPRLAASHLARAVLLQYKLLDKGASEEILAHTLGALR